MATEILNDDVKTCSDACADCFVTCEACARHCIDGGMAEMAECIKLCLDGATLCTACLPLMARDSRYHVELCRLCAEACDACASKWRSTTTRSCAHIRRLGQRRWCGVSGRRVLG